MGNIQSVAQNTGCVCARSRKDEGPGIRKKNKYQKERDKSKESNKLTFSQNHMSSSSISKSKNPRSKRNAYMRSNQSQSITKEKISDPISKSDQKKADLTHSLHSNFKFGFNQEKASHGSERKPPKPSRRNYNSAQQPQRALPKIVQSNVDPVIKTICFDPQKDAIKEVRESLENKSNSHEPFNQIIAQKEDLKLNQPDTSSKFKFALQEKSPENKKDTHIEQSSSAIPEVQLATSEIIEPPKERANQVAKVLDSKKLSYTRKVKVRKDKPLDTINATNTILDFGKIRHSEFNKAKKPSFTIDLTSPLKTKFKSPKKDIPVHKIQVEVDIQESTPQHPDVALNLFKNKDEEILLESPQQASGVKRDEVLLESSQQTSGVKGDEVLLESPKQTPGEKNDEVLLESPKQDFGALGGEVGSSENNTGSTKKSGSEEGTKFTKKDAHEKIESPYDDEFYKQVSTEIFEDAIAIYEKVFSHILQNRKQEISRELFHPKNQDTYVQNFDAEEQRPIHPVPSDVITKLKNIVFDSKMDNVSICY